MKTHCNVNQPAKSSNKDGQPNIFHCNKKTMAYRVLFLVTCDYIASMSVGHVDQIWKGMMKIFI